MVVENATLGNMTMPSVAVPSGGHGQMSHMDNRVVLFMGLVYGLVHAFGPDHLGTLMTLSSAATPGKAFRIGGAWGLGHSFGMVAVAGIFLLVHGLITVDLEKWEHYGNYVIGASMMACAIHFMIYESSFLKEKADGSIELQACACHGGGSLAAAPSEGFDAEALSPSMLLYCGDCDDSSSPWSRSPIKESDYRCRLQCCELDGENTGVELAAESQSEPLLTSAEQDLPGASTKAKRWLKRMCAGRDAKGAVLGLFQGLFCPMGLLGVTFLANLPSMGIAIFLAVFVCISALGTALLSSLWAYLTAYGCSSKISPKFVYRASCGFTLVLGAVWIIFNHFGLVEMLDYAESMVHH